MPRLAILPDFAEEGWLSMDLCAEMLIRELCGATAGRMVPKIVRPAFRRRLSRVPMFGRRKAAVNADRALNRYITYFFHVTRRVRGFEFFHVVDHSYAQLLHAVPAGCGGVFCHDLDAFRCLLEPEKETRPGWYRALARHILAGLQKAALVFHATTHTASQLVRHGLFDPARLIHAPYGVAPEFLADSLVGASVCKIPVETPFLLHVGSCNARKRVDLLLNVFAAVHKTISELQLVKVAGAWTPRHADIIHQHKIGDRIIYLRDLPRTALAGLYRRAALVLLPSDAEGFGLPIIEALACGALVLASDLPSTREAGGDAALYAPPGDLPAWVTLVEQLLRHPERAPSRAMRMARGAQFTWARHAGIIGEAYLRLAG
jgi:glycosyltransferase involved in cell wall biosynthesis